MKYEKYYWLNEDSRLFLSRGYLDDSETPEKRFRDIANNAERILGIAGFADKFEYYLSKGYYSLSTPVICNYGKEKGLPVSCFNSYIPDTMEGILDKVAEVGIMSKAGGGTSGYFGDLRPRGTSISSGGDSSGPVHFMELFDKVASVVSQGKSRRGSFAAYLDVDHPDIKEFLQIRELDHAIQEMSIGVNISDAWMESMIAGDSEKRSIWAEIIKKRYSSGYPYIHFIDNVNNQAPDVYKEFGMRIKSSNLCVTGDQRVVSNLGLLTAKELAISGEELVLFDNNKQVKSSPMKLIERDVDVYKITLDNGLSHSITSYHKVLVRTSNTFKPIKTEDISCENLKVNDLVAIQTNKGLFGSLDKQDEAFLLGLYQADGTQNKDSIHICIWEKDFDLEEEIQTKFNNLYNKYNGKDLFLRKQKNGDVPPVFNENNTGFSSVRKRSLVSTFLKRAFNFEKGYIPDWIWQSNEKTQWQYIRGLFYADGTVNITSGKGEPFYLSITNISEEFLKELQILLLNLGITSAISVSAEACDRLLPDGKGGHKIYTCKTAYRLVCGSKNDGIEFEKNTGFLSRKGVVLSDDGYRDNTKKFRKIKSIEYIGKEDVYCVSVDSDEHHWVCNGFITHNCSEIALYQDKDNSFVCVLASINLLHWDEIKDTDAVETLIYFLDTVNEEFVTKTKDMKHMESARNFAVNQRALGMGVLGWHSYLQSKMIPFESILAKGLNNSIFKTLKEKTDKASVELASFLGEPPLLKGKGRRNTTKIAIAPTTSSSFILGQVSPSIEPLKDNYFTKDLAKGVFGFRNTFLQELLVSKNKNTNAVWDSILNNGGSVQHLDFLSQDEKDVFKTFGEISQKEVIIQAAQRQPYIDQSQSLNIWVHPKTPPKEVSDLMIYAWRNGIKSLYYQRSLNPTKHLLRSLNECKSCEG